VSEVLVSAQGAQVVNEDGRRYVYAVLQSSNQSKEDVDDLEFLFKVRSLIAVVFTQKSLRLHIWNLFMVP
jgi:hypothetical protein